MQRKNSCVAIYHDDEEIVRANSISNANDTDNTEQSYLLDRFSNADGEITLTLDTTANGCADLILVPWGIQYQW